MPDYTIQSISTADARFELPPGAGTDSVHTKSEYCMAITRLASDKGLTGSGIALTLGDGNRLVCEAIELLARPLIGRSIEELMFRVGSGSRGLSDESCLRVPGPATRSRHSAPPRLHHGRI